MKRSWNKVSAFVCTVYFLSLALVPADALAVMDGTTNALSINANSLQPATVNCDSICPTIVSGLSPGKGSSDPNSYTTSAISSHEINTSGGTGWSPADDYWCALHGTVTNAQTGPPNPMPTPLPSNTCNIPMYPGDTGCAQANTSLLACKYYGSQIVPQCMAYEACVTANAGDVTMVALDVVAAAACYTACGYPATTAGCIIAGLAASVVEFVAVTEENQDQVASAIEDTMSAVGLAAAGTAATLHMVASGGKIIADTTSQGAKGAFSTAGQVVSCAAGVMYTGMFVARLMAIINMSNAKSKACSAIQSMESSASVANPGGNPDLNYGNYTPTNGTSGSGGAGTLGSAYGGGTGTSQIATPQGTLTCIEQNGIQQCSASSAPAASVLASTDGGMLSNTGMDKTLAQQAKGVNVDDLLKRFNQGGAGAAMAAALGPGADTDLGKAAINLANQIQQHPDQMKGLDLGGGSVYAGGGHGGGGGQTSAAKPMFGMAAGGGLAASGDSMAFDKTKKAAQVFDEGDIWHEGYKGTIFDIVTNKLSTTRDRIDKEDWQTPLNRALMGLKPLPKDKP